MSIWLLPASLEEAKIAQQQMAEKICLEDNFQEPRWIGGMDVSNRLYDPAKMIYASTVVLDAQTLQVIEDGHSAEKQLFPYIPGFLGFREAPALVRAFNKLKQKPDLLFIDGHGISHPRGLGIASHIGVVLDIPTIGVAKSILVGEPAGVLGEKPGSQVPLISQGQTLGMLVRTKLRSRPLIISTGHRVSLASALKIVRRCSRGYRLPEPTRHAHLAANACRKRCS